MIAGQTHTVTQANGCVASINPTSYAAPIAGGPGTPVAVTTTAGCAWTASTTATAWISNQFGRECGRTTVRWRMIGEHRSGANGHDHDCGSDVDGDTGDGLRHLDQSDELRGSGRRRTGHFYRRHNGLWVRLDVFNGGNLDHLSSGLERWERQR